jgi:hypothetical protein
MINSGGLESGFPSENATMQQCKMLERFPVSGLCETALHVLSQYETAPIGVGDQGRGVLKCSREEG